MLLFLVVVVMSLCGVLGHVRMIEPPCRACLWRFPEFAQYMPEARGNDDEFWCGNVHQFENDNRCGACGDPIDMAQPRETERGGRYYRDVNVRTYTAGQAVPIHLQSNTQNHGGGFEISLCLDTLETEACFQKLVLGNGQTFWPMTLADGTFNVETTATLPAGVTCESCTLRVHYRGAQNWGTCDDSRTCACNPNSGDPPGGMGCSEQQTFRSCSDIKIV